MGAPEGVLATQRPDLGGSLEEYDLEADRAGFIAMAALPKIDVIVQSGTFGVIPVEQLLQDVATDRASDGSYPRGGFTFDDRPFVTKEHGYEQKVDDRNAAIYREYFDHEMAAALVARDVVVRNQEKRAAAAVFNTTTWTGSGLATSVGTKWDVPATATPIANINAARDKVYDGIGMWPNTLIVTRKGFNALRNVAEVKDAIASSGAGDQNRQTDITVQQLAEVFALPKILVAGGTKNTAAEGLAATFAGVWDKTMAMVCITCDEGDDISRPCVGRTMHFTEDGSDIFAAMEEYRDENVRGNIIRARHETQELIIYKETGHLLTSVL